MSRRAGQLIALFSILTLIIVLVSYQYFPGAGLKSDVLDETPPVTEPSPAPDTTTTTTTTTTPDTTATPDASPAPDATTTTTTTTTPDATTTTPDVTTTPEANPAPDTTVTTTTTTTPDPTTTPDTDTTATPDSTTTTTTTSTSTPPAPVDPGTSPLAENSAQSTRDENGVLILNYLVQVQIKAVLDGLQTPAVTSFSTPVLWKQDPQDSTLVNISDQLSARTYFFPNQEGLYNFTLSLDGVVKARYVFEVVSKAAYTADVNHDGKYDFVDFTYVLVHWDEFPEEDRVAVLAVILSHYDK